MSNMNCICIEEPGKVLLQQKEIPIPQKGEALLKIRYTGICGSDLNIYRGTLAYASYPRIPGHEFSAEVVEVGTNEYGIRNGMAITGNPYYNCGECYSCQRGLFNCCMKNQTLGVQRNGVFQQYFTIPVERIYDGKGLDAKALAVVEPFCISYHATERAHVQAGENVLVVGAGTIGIAAMLAAKMKGAHVYVTDVSEPRLDRVKKLGADGIFNSMTGNFEDFVKETTQGTGFDVCIECVGLPDTFMNCIEAAAYRGRVIIVGVGKKPVDFLFSLLQLKELNLLGSRNATKADFMEMIDHTLAGKFDLMKLVTDIYPMENAAKAFEDLNNNQDTMLKVLLEY